MNKAIEENGGLTGPDTRLHIDLKGRHPDDGLTDIAYEKGAAFLRTIETVVGRERFDEWLKGWFSRHEFEPVTTSIFLADIRENLIKGDKELEQKLMLDQWVNEPGIPSNIAKADPQAFAAVDAAVEAFKANQLPEAAAWQSWTTDERLRFLTRIDKKQPAERLAALDGAFSLSRAGNNELQFAFLDLAVANRYDPAVPALEEFLTMQGRRKFVRPLITSLSEDKEWGRPIAVGSMPRRGPDITRSPPATSINWVFSPNENDPLFNYEVTLLVYPRTSPGGRPDVRGSRPLQAYDCSAPSRWRVAGRCLA